MIESKRLCSRLPDGRDSVQTADSIEPRTSVSGVKLFDELPGHDTKSSVARVLSARLLPTVAWCLVSGCFVQPAIAGYGKVPLFFVENRGQVDREVGYMGKGPRFSVYFAHAGVNIAAGESTLHLRFPGANPDAVLEGIDPLPTRANFFIGPQPAWRTNLATFGSIAYRGIYPGIDVSYSGSGDHLKSQFVVAPGANPSVIRLSYEVAERPHVEPDGVLILPTSFGEFREDAPTIYQEREGKRTPVQGIPHSPRRYRYVPHWHVRSFAAAYYRSYPFLQHIPRRGRHGRRDIHRGRWRRQRLCRGLDHLGRP